MSSPRAAARLRLVLLLCLSSLWALGVYLMFPPGRWLQVEVEMSSDNSGTIQVFADPGGGFREHLSARARVIGDGQFHRYRLGLVLQGSPTALRIDPLDGAGRVTIRSIHLSFEDRHQRWRGRLLESWKPAHQLEAQAVSRHGDLHLTSLGNDPWLTIERNPDRVVWRDRFTYWPRKKQLALAGLLLPWFVLLLPVSRDRNLETALRPRMPAELLALAAPLGIFVVLNYQAIRSWWLGDDPCILGTILSNGIWAHFFDAEVWRSFSGGLLMPWSILSLAVDWHVFGLEPAGFYAHHLLSFTVLLLVAYRFLRLHLSPALSSLALSLFVLSAPSAAVAQQLMNRHYLEGMTLALASLVFQYRAIETQRKAWSIFGAVLYALAVTAKEVFVPLIVILPFLPVGRREGRFKAALPFALVTLCYGLWRIHMLGWTNLLSSYGTRLDLAPAGMLTRLGSLLGMGEPWQAILFLGIVCTAIAVLAYDSRSAKAFIGAVFLGIVTPLVALDSMLAPRHFLIPLFAAAAAVGVALQKLRSRQSHSLSDAALACIGTVLLLLASASLSTSPFWTRHPTSIQQHRAEGSFILTSSTDGVLLTTLNDTRYLQCTDELRNELGMGGSAKGPSFCGDRCLCGLWFPEAAFWSYSGSEVAPTAEPEPCDTRGDLVVELRYVADRGQVYWRFGPYEAGFYELVLVSGEGSANVSIPVPMAREGRAPLSLSEPMSFVVKYRSPDGWQTYSPLKTLNP